MCLYWLTVIQLNQISDCFMRWIPIFTLGTLLYIRIRWGLRSRQMFLNSEHSRKYINTGKGGNRFSKGFSNVLLLVIFGLAGFYQGKCRLQPKVYIL